MMTGSKNCSAHQGRYVDKRLEDALLNSCEEYQKKILVFNRKWMHLREVPINAIKALHLFEQVMDLLFHLQIFKIVL